MGTRKTASWAAREDAAVHETEQPAGERQEPIQSGLDRPAVVALQRTAGNAAVTALLQRHPGDSPASVAETAEMPVAEKDDDHLATAIFEQERAILQQWATAVDAFNAVLTSASDKEGETDYLKAAMTHYQTKVLGKTFPWAIVTLITETGSPAVKGVVELQTAFDAEHKRAAAAQKEASARDFFVKHRVGLAELDKALVLASDDFAAYVRRTAQRGESGDENAQASYGIMRLRLVELFEDVEQRLQATEFNQLFQVLSEEWIGSSRMPQAFGETSAARIMIDIEEDFSVRSAHIEGPGGQKIAEQLLKNAARSGDSGVDVFAMKVPRTIRRFKGGGNLASAIVKLDADNRLENDGAPALGDYVPVHRRLMQDGLGPATKVTGD